MSSNRTIIPGMESTFEGGQNQFHYLKLVIIAVISIMLYSCGNVDNNAAIFDEIKSERDSLLNLANNTQKQLDDMNGYFVSISDCLDSIAEQEHILLVSVDPETHRRYSRQEVRQRLNLLSDIILRQRRKIQSLTDSMKNDKDTLKYTNISKMVVYLSQQLEAKEEKINLLIGEIITKNKSIQQLTENVTELRQEVVEVSEKNSELAVAVVEQTKMLNEAFILIADKKRLQDLGILSKGNILKKAKFNSSNIVLNVCQRVDITKIRTIPLMSKKPKILSAVPQNSYSIEDSENNTKKLVIKDPYSFWSLSNVLVIQL